MTSDSFFHQFPTLSYEELDNLSAKCKISTRLFFALMSVSNRPMNGMCYIATGTPVYDTKNFIID